MICSALFLFRRTVLFASYCIPRSSITSPCLPPLAGQRLFFVHTRPFDLPGHRWHRSGFVLFPLRPSPLCTFMSFPFVPICSSLSFFPLVHRRGLTWPVSSGWPGLVPYLCTGWHHFSPRLPDSLGTFLDLPMPFSPPFFPYLSLFPLHLPYAHMNHILYTLFPSSRIYL